MSRNVQIGLDGERPARRGLVRPYKTRSKSCARTQPDRDSMACELGECSWRLRGAVDGEPQLSCLVLALECEGRSIETVEGMGDGARLHPLQAAFADLGAAHAATAPGDPVDREGAASPKSQSLREKGSRRPFGKSVPAARCTTRSSKHRGSRHAGWNMKVLVSRAGAATAGPRSPADPVRRRHGAARMLHMKLLRSPHATPGSNRSIFPKRRRLPGVHLV